MTVIWSEVVVPSDVLEDDDEPAKLHQQCWIDGALWGEVIRFYDDAPTYAYAGGERIGAIESDDAARKAVVKSHPYYERKDQ
jgi:hypothetical protein